MISRERASIHVANAIVNFYRDDSDSVFLRLSHDLRPNILKVYILIGLMVGNVGLWQAKTFLWTRVTEDLRNGKPLETLSVAKQIKIKELCISFRFNYLIYVIYSFLQCSYQTAALQAFRKCRTIISHRGPKGAKRENNAKQQQQQKRRRCGSFLSGMLFTLYESFARQILASLGLFTWVVYVRTYCVPIATLNQNERSRLHFLGDAQIKKRT